MLLVAKHTVARQHNIGLQSSLVMIPNLERFHDPFASSVMTEALQYAGISPLPRDAALEKHSALVAAAAAANGIGLCKSYTALEVCDQEKALLPDSRVLGIEYSNVSLSVFLSAFQAAPAGIDILKTRAWDLSSRNRRDIEGYWQLVKETIQRLPREWAHKKITDILVMRESSLDGKFLDVLRDALHEVLPDEVMRQLNIASGDSEECKGAFIDPTFAAARSAAELAKRVMEAPDGCVESSYCKWWRKLVR